MEITILFGYLGALLIGMVLGLIGGGGSILTVPIFVYILGIEPVLATAYSLFVVGSSAMVGAIRNLKKGMVELKTAIVFSIPAFIAVYVARKYLLPAIPDTLLDTSNFVLSKSMGIMLLFAIIMLLASISMIRGRKEGPIEESTPSFNYPMIILEGLGVGLLTGIVGAGGGFLIIPALVLLAKLPMKKAVATSLLIIGVKSLIGFIGDVQNLNIEWGFLMTFTSLSIVGIFLGIWLNKFIEGAKLKKAFGWFVLIMALIIVMQELS